MQRTDQRSLKSMVASAMLVMALALFLSACGDSGSSTTGDDTSSDSSAKGSGDSVVAEARAATVKAEKEPQEIASASLGSFEPKPQGSIYLVSCDLAIEGCSNIKKGVEAATDAIGYQYEECDQHSTSPESGPQCFKNAINAKPDVILANGMSTAVSGTGYEDAEKAGIPVISMFGGNPAGTGVAAVGEGNFCKELGEALGQWSIAESDGQTNAIIPSTNEFVCTAQGKDGLMASLEKCSDCAARSFEINFATATTTLPQQIRSELLGNPDVNAVLGSSELPPLIAAEVVQQMGRSDIQVAGLFGGASNLDQLHAGGPQEAETTNGSREPGWAAVDAAARLIAGEEVPADIPITWMTLTTKNASKFPDGFQGAREFEKQFKELWGRS